MQRISTGQTVLDEAVDRMVKVFESGARVVACFSGGKDSTIVLETCIVAASITGRLPLDVVMRDEEIMLPGTFEYAERVASRPEVRFHWLYACQPVINTFNRENPYFWVFDPTLPPERWVRQPPSYSQRIADLNIQRLVTPERFQPFEAEAGVVRALGLRADESAMRKLGVASSGGYMTAPDQLGVRSARPIYDFTDGDVWRAIGQNKWDYNRAYDVMVRTGIKRRDMRIAPPSQNPGQVPLIRMASQAWPTWFDKVCERLPGFRSVANYGIKLLTPNRHSTETWEDTYRRTCIRDAPQWIAERASAVLDRTLSAHTRHATTPFPQIEQCLKCSPTMGSWRALSRAMYLGDPFSQKASCLKYVEPEFFRVGAGTWGGRPAF